MSDYETTQRWRNITVGVFVLIALCALVWLIFIFNDLPSKITEIRSYQVNVKFPSAQGVQKDTPVRFCGYQIGRVTAIMPPQPRLDENTGRTYHQTMCVLSIDNDFKTIPWNVEVKVMTRGLGSSYIELFSRPDEELKHKDPNRPETIYLVDGMELQGSTGMTSEFFPQESQEKLDKLMDNIIELVKNTNDIVGNSDNKENLQKSLDNLSEITAKVSVLLDEFQVFVTNANQISEQVSETMAEIRQIARKINEGEGTTGKMVNDGRLYENLLENTDQLEVLIKDLRDFIAEYRAKGVKVKLR
ncbi:MAG: MCE family protein [Sedimentisphaerales bacterium]|nr:MCE family protein [Sedimentisphaerales bacterium]